MLHIFRKDPVPGAPFFVRRVAIEPGCRGVRPPTIHVESDELGPFATITEASEAGATLTGVEE